MGNVQDLINSSLRVIGVLDSGETPTSTESNDALAALNQMITGWSAAGMPVYQESKDTVVLTGATSYPLPGTRPVRLTSAQVSYSGISFPVEIVPSQVWTRPKDRTATSKFARELYYDGAFPTGNVSLWPAPGFGSTLDLYSLKPLSQFISLSDTVSLPPGYEHALRYGLAQALAPEYGAVMSQEAAAVLAEAKNSIVAMNTATLGAAAPPQPVPAAS